MAKEKSFEFLLNPPPGSAAAAARDFGIDLTVTVEQLKLTPEERLRRLDSMRRDIQAMREEIRKQDAHRRP